MDERGHSTPSIWHVSGMIGDQIWHGSGTRSEGIGRVGRRITKRSFGSIRKLPTGNFQARFSAPTGEMVSAPSTFLARIDAEAWLHEERKRLENPEEWRSPKDRLERARAAEAALARPTFEEYVERWIDTRRNSRGEPLRPLTKDKYRSSLRTHVYPTFGPIPLNAITRAHVRQWYDELEAGPAAKSQAYTTLRTILNTAVDEDELLERNPARIRGGGARPSKKHVQPASLAELEVMVEAMPDRLQLLLLLATWCALRSGELRELRRSDIVVEHDQDGMPVSGWVHVRRGMVRARRDLAEPGRRTEVVVGGPKTEAGVRSVSIPDFLLPAVEEHLDRFAAPDPDGLLFTSARDARAHLPESTLNGRAAVLDTHGKVVKVGFGWREARRRAGREDLDIHDLRHTGASWAGEEGASLAELMHRLGHSTPSMALRYQHSRLERDRELGRRLSARAQKPSV